MFKTRLLSGIVLVILALFLIISGHEILLFATLAISCIGMFELYRVLFYAPKRRFVSTLRLKKCCLRRFWGECKVLLHCSLPCLSF